MVAVFFCAGFFVVVVPFDPSPGVVVLLLLLLTVVVGFGVGVVLCFVVKVVV